MLQLLQQLYNFYVIKRQLKRMHYATIILRNSIQYGDCVEEKIYFKKALKLFKTRLLRFNRSFDSNDDWIRAIANANALLTDEFFQNIDKFSIKCNNKNDVIKKFDALAVDFFSLYKINKYSNFEEIVNLCNFLMSDLSEINRLFENSRN